VTRTGDHLTIKKPDQISLEVTGVAARSRFAARGAGRAGTNCETKVVALLDIACSEAAVTVINTRITVSPDGAISTATPLPAGEYEVAITTATPKPRRSVLDLPVHDGPLG
jgi:hypothetical protein